MNKLKCYVLIFIVVLGSSILGGCDWDFSDSSSSGSGYYQYANLVSQSPSIEFVVDDESLGEIEFSYATTHEYISSGTYDIEFNQILPNTENDNFIDDDSLRVYSNTLHSYILYGDTDSPSSYTVEMDISDIYDDDFDDEYAMVQFVNLINNEDSVDMYLLDADDNLINQTADYSLAMADTSGDVELPEGDYKIIFTEVGTDTILAQKNDISISEAEALIYILTSYTVAGSDNTRYKIIELSSSGARTLSNQAANGHIRVANGVSNTDAISIAVGDNTDIIETDIAIGDLSEDIEISISSSDEVESTSIYILNSEDSTLLDGTTLNVYADDQILLLSAGDASSTVSVNETEEDLRTIETHVKILFSHSIFDQSDGSLEVKILEEGGNPDSYDAELSVSYLSTQMYEIESGSYDIYIYNSDNELLIEHTLYSVEAGNVVNLITTDYETSGAPYQIFEHIN
jgi:hypothetical protein